jgi:hypothetical protein
MQGGLFIPDDELDSALQSNGKQCHEIHGEDNSWDPNNRLASRSNEPCRSRQ